jgi:tryptophanase
MNNILRLADFTPKHEHRAYANGAVRFHHPFTKEERLVAAQKAGWNVFQFPSEMVIGDLLSDSGTTTPTLEQLSLMILGDEAYGTNWGYVQLIEKFEETFGVSKEMWATYLFHQCRAAEHALFTQIGAHKSGLKIPSNGHFDTTRANIEANNIEAVDLHIADAALLCQTSEEYHFKGNVDIPALENLLAREAENVPVVYCTITNNTNGGQPVSMKNLRAIKKLCDVYKKPFFLDTCRFAENAWFIKQYEAGFKNVSILDIVHEIFALCDGFTISLKKDGLANMGGALCLKKDSPLIIRYPNLLDNLTDHQILTEGHPTYGGLSGRDIMVIVGGLGTVITEEYLNGRINQVQKFGSSLASLGIPVVEPFGGHAVYIDIDKFFEGTRMKRGDFGGISLTALLLLSGPRLCELGAFAFGKYDSETQTEKLPPFNYVRAAIPRNKYEEQDLLFVADCIKNLHDKRDGLPRAVPTFGREKSLRHFKAHFELVPHS